MVEVRFGPGARGAGGGGAGGAILGLFLGLLLFCVSLPLLWLNEWNSVQNYDALREVCYPASPSPFPGPTEGGLLRLRPLSDLFGSPPSYDPHRSAPPPLFPTDAWLAGASPSRWSVWLRKTCRP